MTQPILLSKTTPSHVEQSSWIDQDESTPKGSLRPCLKFRSACLSFSLQETFDSALTKKLKVVAKKHSKKNT